MDREDIHRFRHRDDGSPCRAAQWSDDAHLPACAGQSSTEGNRDPVATAAIAHSSSVAPAPTPGSGPAPAARIRRSGCRHDECRPGAEEEERSSATRGIGQPHPTPRHQRHTQHHVQQWDQPCGTGTDVVEVEILAWGDVGSGSGGQERCQAHRCCRPPRSAALGHRQPGELAAGGRLVDTDVIITQLPTAKRPAPTG